jgi:hypothetical protein
MIPCSKLFGGSLLLNGIVFKLYIILIYNSLISTANFLILANVFLGVGILLGCAGMFHRKEGRIQVLECPAPVQSLLRTFQVGKAGQKNH